jgi:hypothetical protein
MWSPIIAETRLPVTPNEIEPVEEFISKEGFE